MEFTDPSQQDGAEPSDPANFAAFEHLSSPVMVCDHDLVIRSVNRAGYRMFKRLQSDIRTDLPHFDIDRIVGQPIDVFHRNPDRQRNMAEGFRRTHKARFKIGSTHLAFHASPAFDDAGKLRHLIVEWQDRTAEHQAEEDLSRFLNDIQSMAAAHEKGDIQHMLHSAGYAPGLAAVAAAVNGMVRGHMHLQQRTVSAVEEYAAGNLDFELERFPGAKGDINNSLEAVRGQFRQVIGAIDTAATAMVEGNLSLPINTSGSGGDYRKVLKRFDGGIGDLSRMIQALNQQILEVTRAAQLVSNSSQTLSHEAERASQAIDGISSSFDETESMVRATSDAAQRAHHVAMGAEHMAEVGRDTMCKLLAAMEAIDAKARAIGSINKVIDEIAFQTNLLALNAAVEAARAGEFGRGFAVVASEVRNLAGRSARAAQETTVLIEDSTLAIRDGVGIAQEMDAAFNALSEAFADVGTQISEISIASREQQTAVSFISNSVGEIVNTAATTDSESSILATGAMQLTSASAAMQERLGRFQLRAPVKSAAGFDLSTLPPGSAAQVERMLADRSFKKFAAE